LLIGISFNIVSDHILTDVKTEVKKGGWFNGFDTVKLRQYAPSLLSSKPLSRR
jgi:hypothetical protein